MNELSKIREALEAGLEAAEEVAADTHQKYAGYKPQRHAYVDAEVQKIKEALSVLSALQEAMPVAFHLGNPDGTMSTLGAIYRSRDHAEYHIASYGGELDAAIVPLYARPQPAQQDARDSERLNFIAENGSGVRTANAGYRNLIVWGAGYPSQGVSLLDNLRAAIDAALAAAKEKQCGS